MRKFLLRWIFFSLPLLVTLGAAEMALRAIPNPYEFKRQQYIRRGSEFQILCLGNSQTLYGLNPGCFHDPTFNGAHLSQSWDLDLALLKEFSPRMPKLRLVIIPVSYFSAFRRLSEGQESFRTKNYVLYYHLPQVARHPQDFFEVLNLPRINVEKLLGLRTIQPVSEEITRDGFGLDPPKGADLEVSARAAVERHSVPGNDMTPRLSKELFEIVQLCEARGTKLLLLNPPTSGAYRKRLRPAQVKATLGLVQSVILLHPQTEYLDLSADPRFVDANFSDADHLNAAGAEKLSLLLDRWNAVHAGYSDQEISVRKVNPRSVRCLP